MRYFFLLVMLCGAYFSQAQTDSIFYQGTYAQLQKEAREKNMPYFMYCYIIGSDADEQMKFLTFTPNLVAQTKGKYLKPLRVQAFSIFDDYIVKKYQIEEYPETLIFTAEDSLVERIQGIIPESELIKKLLSHTGASGKADSIDVFKENLDKQLVNKLQLASKTEGIYKFEVKDANKSSTEAVGIQLGVFGDFYNLTRAVYDLGLKDNDNILVSLHRAEENEKVYLRLVLGPFDTVADGEQYLEQLRVEKGLYGFLIDLENFRPLEAITDDFGDSPFDENPFGDDGN